MSVVVLFIIVIVLSVCLVLFAVKGSKWVRRIGVSITGAILATILAGALTLVVGDRTVVLYGTGSTIEDDGSVTEHASIRFTLPRGGDAEERFERAFRALLGDGELFYYDGYPWYTPDGLRTPEEVARELEAGTRYARVIVAPYGGGTLYAQRLEGGMSQGRDASGEFTTVDIARYELRLDVGGDFTDPDGELRRLMRPLRTLVRDHFDPSELL